MGFFECNETSHCQNGVHSDSSIPVPYSNVDSALWSKLYSPSLSCEKYGDNPMRSHIKWYINCMTLFFPLVQETHHCLCSMSYTGRNVLAWQTCFPEIYVLILRSSTLYWKTSAKKMDWKWDKLYRRSSDGSALSTFRALTIRDCDIWRNCRALFKLNDCLRKDAFMWFYVNVWKLFLFFKDIWKWYTLYQKLMVKQCIENSTRLPKSSYWYMHWKWYILYRKLLLKQCVENGTHCIEKKLLLK